MGMSKVSDMAKIYKAKLYLDIFWEEKIVPVINEEIKRVVVEAKELQLIEDDKKSYELYMSAVRYIDRLKELQSVMERGL